MFIDGDLLRKQREIRGWTMNDMAIRACLSVKQIRQLEEGGSESFYSSAVKWTAAKKVASLLGISITQQVDPSHSSSLTDALQSEGPVLIQETNSIETVVSQRKAETIQAEASESELQQPISKQSQKSSQFSWWVMAALFGSALVMAAWLNPSAEPVATETPPPLQILSSDVSETASSVSGAVQEATSSASSPSQMAVTRGDEPALSAVSAPAVRVPTAAETASK